MHQRIELGRMSIEIDEMPEGQFDVQLEEPDSDNAVVLSMNRDAAESLYQSLKVALGHVHPECVGEIR